MFSIKGGVIKKVENKLILLTVRKTDQVIVLQIILFEINHLNWIVNKNIWYNVFGIAKILTWYFLS